MRLAIVDGETLTLVLRQMSDAPRQLSGSAFWSFSEQQVVIKWTSYEQPIDVQGGILLPGLVMVPGRVMNQLGAVVDLKGETEIQWDSERGRLRIGMHSAPGTLVDSEPPFELPLDARERDLLKQWLRWRTEQVSQAGYGDETSDIETRWDQSIERAASAFAWTGLSQEMVRAVFAEVLRNNHEPAEGSVLVLNDESLMFHLTEYQDPLQILAALYRTLEGRRWWRSEERRKEIKRFLASCPGGVEVYSDWFRDSLSEPESLQGLFEMAAEQHTPNVLSKENLKDGIRAGVPNEQLHSLMDDMLGLKGNVEDPHQPSIVDPQPGIVDWLFIVVPRLYPNPSGRLLWFIEVLGETLRFVSSDLAEDITACMSEWIWDTGGERIEEIVAKLQKYELLEHQEIRDALSEALGEWEIEWEDVVKTG